MTILYLLFLFAAAARAVPLDTTPCTNAVDCASKAEQAVAAYKQSITDINNAGAMSDTDPGAAQSIRQYERDKETAQNSLTESLQRLQTFPGALDLKDRYNAVLNTAKSANMDTKGLEFTGGAGNSKPKPQTPPEEGTLSSIIGGQITRGAQTPPGSAVPEHVEVDPPPTWQENTELLQTGNSTDLSRAGNSYAAARQPEKAITDFTQALKRDPNNTNALKGMIEAKVATGDQQGAVTAAKALLALDPKNQIAQLVIGHGDSISQGGSRMKLKTDFGASRSADADSAASPGARSFAGGPGATPTRRAQNTSAIQVQSPSAADVPRPQRNYSPVQILIMQSQEMLRMRDFTGALMSARQAVDAEPANSAAWSMLAEISNAAGNSKGALQAASHALSLDPVNPQALRAKAYAEVQLGNYADAYQDALRATQLDPQNGLGFLYLAMAEEKLGKTADALKHYEQAVSLDTTLDPMVQEARKRLAGGSATGLTTNATRHLVRGGAMAGGLVLVLLGLLGTAAGKQLTTTAKRIIAAKQDEAATILEGVPAVGPGSLLGGNFRVTEELGRGGMGVVYGAMDEALQRRVAIKQLQRNEQTTSEDLERFLKEARLVASLKHPNLAEIYSLINEGDIYLVFERVDGEPLDKIISRNGKIPAAQARRLLCEVGAALDYAHSRKIIHRDLKPSNIMITKDGSSKVMDFGIAHQSQTATALTKTAAYGTPPYMAPEQAFGSVSKASDLYALAVMTYQMLTGRLPFEGPDFLEQKLNRTYTPASQREASLRRELDAFFTRALDPDPTKRHSDAKAFLRAFDEACTALGKPV